MVFLINFYLFLIMFYLFNMFMYFYIKKIVIFLEFELMNLNSIKIELLLLIDWISLLFISVVLLISIMVIFYSLEYMSLEINISRFIMMIYMFVISMMLMIISPNLISILLGWDGLGLISYCLVIYYQSKKSFNSGMVTVLTNRFGDILILMSIILMISYGTWNYMFINKMNNMIYILLILASFTKSAQIPFSSWLPMAMAAPTPISSLVHSSTLVTAGVYMLIRLNFLLTSKNLINFIMIISLITMFFSGLSANFEYDLKKIIALSTLSQLGLMMFCLSMKLMEISLFHLLMHALFKSMLFMCAGLIIHLMAGYQDIRFISMIMYNLPLVSIMFNCAIFSLCGVPFLSGFFSKDLILEMYMISSMNKFIFNILFISMGLTIWYSIRLMYYSFIKVPQMLIFNNYLSLNNLMSLSMYLLFFFSMYMGLMMSWILFSMKNMIFLPFKMKILIYNYMMLGMLLGLLTPKFFFNNYFLNYLMSMHLFFSLMWFLSYFFNYWTFHFLNFSNKMVFNLDLGWLEYISGLKFFKLINILFKIDFFMKSYYFSMIFFLIMVFLVKY